MEVDNVAAVPVLELEGILRIHKASILVIIVEEVMDLGRVELSGVAH